jgi:hypothetical protein
MAQKHASEALFDAFTRNSLPTAALIREILDSHPLQMRAILINLSQKIAKFQTNADASNGRFQANIWPFSAAEKRTFSLILWDFHAPQPPWNFLRLCRRHLPPAGVKFPAAGSWRGNGPRSPQFAQEKRHSAPVLRLVRGPAKDYA